MGDGLASLVVNGILDGPAEHGPEAHGPDAFGLENGSGSTEVQGNFEELGRADFARSALDGIAWLESADGSSSLGERDVFEGQVSPQLFFESNAHRSFDPSSESPEFECGIKTPELQPDSDIKEDWAFSRLYRRFLNI